MTCERSPTRLQSCRRHGLVLIEAIRRALSVDKTSYANTGATSATTRISRRATTFLALPVSARIFSSRRCESIKGTCVLDTTPPWPRCSSRSPMPISSILPTLLRGSARRDYRRDGEVASSAIATTRLPAGAVPARAGTSDAWVAPPSYGIARCAGTGPDAHKWAPRGGPSVASRREAKGYRAGCSATGPPSLRGRYSSRRHATRATTAQRSATAATFLVTVTPIIAMEEVSITSHPGCPQDMIDAKCHFVCAPVRRGHGAFQRL